MTAAALRAVRARLVAGLAALACAGALACGHCVEDRIAAVYDHALVQRALASGHRLAYFAWDGPGLRDAAQRRRIVALVEASAGIEKGSARVSVEPAAIAVAFDPRRTSAASVGAALQRKLAPLKLALVPLLPAGAEGGAQRLDAGGIERRGGRP